MNALNPEDEKLVTLARSARARTGADQGAAIRDVMGRTYAASTVSLPSLHLTALQAAVAAAISSGSNEFEAAVVFADAEQLDETDARLLEDVGAPLTHVVQTDGTMLQ